MSARFVGFDLGTTNSAAAVFDGEQVEIVRSAQGGALTPSVVRYDSRGGLQVGGRARRYLETDPDNTRTGFKRLMGTETAFSFPASGLSRTPAELSAEVLRAMRVDVEQQCGFAPARAVVTVPALFELPQTSATSKAAALAGFAQVELLQEPVASALAAGWRAAQGRQAWLVFDLGGGTFDVSLLETRDGLLRVVGHDGDNFLGGRDIDREIVDWALAQLGDHAPSRSNPAHGGALRALAMAAEEAKIELSTARSAVLALPRPLEVDGAEVEVDLELDRATLDRLCCGLVDRTVEVCQRLLAANGMRADQLERVVMVGGPTVMPIVRQRVAEQLSDTIDLAVDPMTLVARGAALYAATAGLDARPTGLVAVGGGAAEAPSAGARPVKLFLQYPPVTADLTPYVLGRVTDPAATLRPARVRLVRDDGGFQSDWVDFDAEQAFVATVELLAYRQNRYRLEVTDSAGGAVPVEPPTVTLVHGVTIGDPPLSRSIGVALANGNVRTYFERGTPLPARRTFVHHTIATIAPGGAEHVLRVPLVQGEYSAAHLNRLVGSIDIPASEIERPLVAASAIEVTLQLDRGGNLAATALVPELQQTFSGVAHLLVPEASPEALAVTLDGLHQRFATLRVTGFREGLTALLRELEVLEVQLSEIGEAIDSARGGDADAAQQARRTLIALDGRLAELEDQRRWPELESDAVGAAAWAASEVGAHGSAAEQRLLDRALAALDAARESGSVARLERQVRVVRNLGNAAFQRDPASWTWYFERAASRVHQARDLAAAEALVRRGRDAVERGDADTLRGIVKELWGLLPGEVADADRSHGSGVR